MKTKLLLRGISLLLPAILLSTQILLAQTRKITGKVTDATLGTPIRGATVQVKSTGIGVVTDTSGNYSINFPANSSTLVFSYVGFAVQEIAVGAQNIINVKLAESTDKLSEVVVVGYGTQRKREVTSAITTITAEQFNKGNISDVAQLMQGKVPGLSVTRAGGDPNAGFVLRLRGLATLGANTQPLVVLDGQVGADINTVDPSDIKSIDVLKDGSAAAIYGTRGTAGVIIITTKSGTRGTAQINYNGAVTAEDPVKFTHHMTGPEFRAFIQPSGVGADTSLKGTDYGANTDWNNEITRTALSQVHNLSFSGGSPTTTYAASVNYRQSQGVAIRTGFDQINGHLNLSQRALNNKLVFTFNLNMTRRKSELGFPDAFKYATIYNPTAPVHSTDPLYDLTGGGYFEANLVDYSNPVAMLEQNSNQQEIKRFNIAGTAEYEIIKGLKFLIRYGQQTYSSFHNAYLPIEAFISRNYLINATGFGRHGYAYRQEDESSSRLYENTLTYDGRITDKLRLNAVAGYSYQDFLNQGFGAEGGNFVTNESSDNLGAALDFLYGLGTARSYKNSYKLIAFFGRINLNYNDIAFLSASLRHEGSSEFGENEKWGNFPAVSGGLDVRKVFNLPAVINTLKVRASYGVTGSIPPSPYLSLDRLTVIGNGYSGNGVYSQVYGGVGINPNPDLKWERKGEIDVGLDFAFLGTRLTGTFDYYSRSTKDLIFLVTVPSPPNLYTQTWKNIGQLDNDGFEASLSYDVIRGKNFSWTTGANYSHYHIVLTKLDSTLKGSYVGATNLGTPGQEATQLTRAVEGEPIGILYGYRYLGVNKDGKYLFDDGTGNGVTADQNPPRTVIGNGLPKFEFGWTNTFHYRNFDLNFFLRGAIGHQLINTYRAFYENPNIASSYNVVNTKFFNPSVNDAQIYSSLHVEKASFVKLDNATLGYNFNLPKTKSVRNLRLYFTVQNLFTITDYTGVDPEVRYQDQVGTAAPNVLAPGIDRRETWVYTRSFTFGINLGF
ncbi:MAG TPA: SusC/RagA family TonB-linked outer membrane protein [Chitinophagaceae bacterium]